MRFSLILVPMLLLASLASEARGQRISISGNIRHLNVPTDGIPEVRVRVTRQSDQTIVPLYVNRDPGATTVNEIQSGENGIYELVMEEQPDAILIDFVPRAGSGAAFGSLRLLSAERNQAVDVRLRPAAASRPSTSPETEGAPTQATIISELLAHLDTLHAFEEFHYRTMTAPSHSPFEIAAIESIRGWLKKPLETIDKWQTLRKSDRSVKDASYTQRLVDAVTSKKGSMMNMYGVAPPPVQPGFCRYTPTHRRVGLFRRRCR